MTARAIVSAVVLSGCGAAPGGEAPSTFIALQRDFEGFEGWEPFSSTSDGSTGTHNAGTVTVYLKARPPAGSNAFPMGTVIVKVIPATAANPEEQIFAMAKRGGTFNAKGAAGWEWFELQRSASGAPVIVWRGVGAPAGERYSQVSTSCNDCHVGAVDNDFVRSAPLALGGLQ